MKNKKTVYFLIPAVLLVWVLIFYRVSDGLQAGNPYYNGSAYDTNSKAPAPLDTLSFELKLDYPDPFLGKNAVARHYVAASQVQASVAKSVVKPAVAQADMPDYTRFKYIGTVEHKTNKDQVALIAIKGNSYMLRKGESAEEVQVLRIYKDSVELKSGKHLFYVRK